ncbi:MAG: polysaccharide biosynthesis C-terminal domain-containing protein, partial [Acetobacteraceae bacterium]|nr:polysaccharide biosynthesis C-terminal domain-containing protein [Acetobacteraceae bacterium]
TLNRAIEFALFLTLPATLALAVASYPIMLVLFGRGAFDAHSAHLSAQSLSAYALGLPAYVLLKVLAPGFFARGDTSTPVKIGVATLALNFALNLALMGPLQHVGPPLATSIAAWFNAGCLGGLLLRRRFLRPDAELRRRLPRMAFASAAMAVALWFAEDPIFAALGMRLRWLALAFLVGLGLVAYFLAGQATGAFDVRDAFTRLAGRRNKRQPVPQS